MGCPRRINCCFGGVGRRFEVVLGAWACLGVQLFNGIHVRFLESYLYLVGLRMGRWWGVCGDLVGRR